MDVWGFFAGTRQNPPQKHLIFILIISNTNFYCHILQKYCSEEYERTQKSFYQGAHLLNCQLRVWGQSCVAAIYLRQEPLGISTMRGIYHLRNAREYIAKVFYDEGDIPSEKCLRIYCKIEVIP